MQGGPGQPGPPFRCGGRASRLSFPFLVIPRKEAMRPMLGRWMVLVACLIAVAGCNTIAGAGKDMQKVGEKVEKAAK